MEKDFIYIELFELYKGLLTERQRELFESHFIFDLSLSEIAEPNGTTRQSVYDAVKKVKAKLDEFESVLHLKEKFSALKDLADKTDAVCAAKIIEILGR